MSSLDMMIPILVPVFNWDFVVLVDYPCLLGGIVGLVKGSFQNKKYYMKTPLLNSLVFLLVFFLVEKNLQ